MLNLKLVRTFVVIAETGSFIEAAQRLNLAQSTVSLQLQKLEETLGTTLIQRNHSGCHPTSHGRTVLPYARALLQSAEQMLSAVKGTSVKVGCSGNIASYYISEELKRFLAAENDDTQKRDISWDIKVSINPEVAELLSAGAIDLAAMEWPPTNCDFDVRPWRREPMLVIVPHEHRLAKSEVITANQFMELDFIGGEPGSGTGTLLRKVLGKRADKIRITHNLQGTEAVKSAVEAGLGCSIVLAGAVRAQSARFAVLELEGIKLEKLFYVAIQAGLPETAIARKLFEFIAAGFCARNVELKTVDCKNH